MSDSEGGRSSPDRIGSPGALGRPGRLELLGLLAILLVAAALRLPGLAERGQFDSDQGHDMLTLAAFTRDGVVPLLGPKTSVGEFHHGAFYYFLLAPAAAVSNDDPVVVTGWLALLGIGAVALTWWLARSIAGALAGLLAGLILALSPAGVEESTFIWNPNAIPFFATLALAAAWRARETGRARWWALAIGAAGAVVQLHVLGLVFFVAVLALGLLELRRNRAAWRGLVGGLAITALLFLPLAVYELRTGFLETRRVLDYLGGGEAANGDALSALVFTLLRVVGWPIVGLVTDVPTLAAAALAVLVALVAWRVRTATGRERSALAWLIGILVWSIVTLAFVAPGLQVVVAGLPNDHYHAFLDPVVAVLFGVTIAALLERGLAAWRARDAAAPGPARGSTAAPDLFAGAIGMIALVGILAIEALRFPSPDTAGGWAAARDAGNRIVEALDGPPVTMVSLPSFKSAEGIEFPIREAARRLAEGSASTARGVVIVCDRLLESQIGAACGGPAEDGFMSDNGAPADPIDRFDASTRTSISVYLPVASP